MIWLNLAGNILWQMVYMLFSPLFWLVVALVWWQNKRLSKQKSSFFHLPAEKVGKKTLQSVVFGLLGGFVGSVLLLVLGVNVAEIGIEYLWILALILSLINMRFVCFAYAGGILTIVNVFCGVPVLSGAQLIALVGVLHFVEGMLVYLSGHLQAVPIYIKWRDGRIVGAFNMQNFWPLPLIALYVEGAALAGTEPLIMMPAWWPLLPSAFGKGFTLYMLAAVLAALGYSDLAVTHSVRQKTKSAAKNLLIYGAVMIILAFLGAQNQIMLFLAGLAAPLGHELIIYFDKKAEENGEPIFTESSEGVRILDVLENSPARKAGIASGDIIMSLNKASVRDISELTGGYWRIKRGENYFQAWLPADNWGIIPVPRVHRGKYVYFGGNFELLKLLWRKVKKIFSKIKNVCDKN